MPEIERRAAEVPVAKDLKVGGLAAVYNRETEIFPGLREKIADGAFKRALDGTDDVRLLVEHDRGRLLARSKSGTLRLRNAKKGLDYEGDLPDTQEGRDIATLLERGDLDGASIGFIVLKESWVYDAKRGDLRTVEEAQLFDVSLVSFPAYAETTAALRSRFAGPNPLTIHRLRARAWSTLIGRTA